MIVFWIVFATVAGLILNLIAFRVGLLASATERLAAAVEAQNGHYGISAKPIVEDRIEVGPSL